LAERVLEQLTAAQSRNKNQKKEKGGERKMKTKLITTIMMTLFLAGIVFYVAPVAARAKSAPYLEAQCRVTWVYMGHVSAGVLYEGSVEGEWYDGYFEGNVGGPYIHGTVEGVDHFIIDSYGIGHCYAYATITDLEGDKLSFHFTVLDTPKTPYLYICEGEARIIDGIDDTIPDPPVHYSTDEKYDDLVGCTFRVEGTARGIPFYIGMKWYLP
jgi:hypothetical protein